MDEQQIKTLRKMNGGLKSKLSLSEKYFGGIKNDEVDMEMYNNLLNRLEKIETCYQKYLENYSDILIKMEDNHIDYAAVNLQYEDFENRYFKIKSEYQTKLDLYRSNNIDKDNKNSSIDGDNLSSKKQFSSVIKLPEVKLPTFDGSLDQWLRFKDSFEAMVINQTNLPDIQKFYYLDNAVSGDAKKVISKVEFSATGFHLAWKTLLERFDVKRAIVEKHIAEIFNLKHVHKESPENLQSLVDNTSLHLRALEQLGQDIKSWDMLVIHIISQCLDRETRKLWESEIEIDKMPTWDEMSQFLQKRSKVLKSVEDKSAIPTASTTTNSNFKFKYPQIKTTNKTFMLNIPSGKISCIVCNQNHFINNCHEFLKQSPQGRYSIVRQLNLCLNCLRTNHLVKDCAFGACKICNRKHHSLLHMNQPEAASNSRSTRMPVTPYKNSLDTSSKHNSSSFEQSKQPNINNHSSHSQINVNDNGLQNKSNTNSNNEHSQSSKYRNSNSTQSLDIGRPVNISHNNPTSDSASYCSSEHQQTKKQILLSTAVLLIKNAHNSYIPCRVLLDSASQSNFVTSKLVEYLQIPKDSHLSYVSGLNNSTTNISYKITTNIQSRFNKYNEDLEFLVVPEIGNLPTQYIDISMWSLPLDIDLADPEFNIPNSIDLLLGAETFFKILKNGYMEISNNLPILKETVFGWIVSGRVETHSYFMSSNVNNSQLDKGLTKFWEVESCIETKKALSVEEVKCEELFLKTYKRNENGRFIVQLPFNELVAKLGDSRNSALNRFSYLESKLNQNENLKNGYINFMREYEALGHMSVCLEDHLPKEEYFLPHHAVFKASSTTTKLRVVFDASAKGSTDISLNETLMIGPVVQDDLFSLILRFRKHLIAYTADIEKMFRQIQIDEIHTQYQKIFWRENSLESVKIYKLNTVTYGTSSAPYLATKVIQQLAIEEENKYPLASIKTMKDFYMDDLLSGDENENAAIQSYRQLVEMFATAGMKLRKWTSNNNNLLEQIPLEDREQKFEFANESIKTLGLIWQPKIDKLSFCVQPVSQDENITKRSVLSDISKLFDPLGLLAPVIIKAKILIQQIWLAKIDWDSKLPQNLEMAWLEYRNNLISINNISFNRCVIPGKVKFLELHGFADASQSAYGACIYLRYVDEDKILVSLLCSKSRVAPLKVVSLPRLELNAAYLLSQLVEKVKHAMDIHFSQIVLWSDSSIVLSWIKLPPHQLKTYVANRTSEIQNITRDMEWRHISGRNNPADYVSRGIMPEDLQNLDIWWKGPAFLQLEPNHWPKGGAKVSNICIHQNLELKHNDFTFAIQNFEPIIRIEDFSSFLKLKRIVALVIRYKNKIRHKGNRPTVFTRNELKVQINKMPALSTLELENSLKTIIRIVQYSQFRDDINHLMQHKCLSRKSKIINLTPFLDTDGLLRVGGRLHNSEIDFDKKHQYILPHNNHFTVLLFRHYHIENMHSGVQATLATVRQRFWPINGKNVVKKVIHECLACFKAKPHLLEQIMGSLPQSRTTIARPFNTTGVDFCGPFTIKYKNQRKGVFNKVYVCIFVCFVTKAIHLEIVEDATSEAFIVCLKRFCARRGKCHTLWSDNAGNFVGANNQLRELAKIINKENNDIINFCSNEGIDWKFIPPRSPHFGGLWESAVKMFKTHLKRIVGDNVLTLEQLNTLSIIIEGILNSRPISPMSSDPNDLEPLTPGHFLTGGPINQIIEPDVTHLPKNRLTYWKIITQMTQHFWKRFSKEYLYLLQQKSKWHESKPNLEVNDLVLIHEENVPSTRWLMGRVIKPIMGKDNYVRVAILKTKGGTLERAVTKLSKLPFN